MNLSNDHATSHGEKECVTHHACACIQAERDRYKALIEGMREFAEDWRYSDEFVGSLFRSRLAGWGRDDA